MRHLKAGPSRSAFSLIEVIGVLAVMAILASLLVPNVVRKIVQARATKEEVTLNVLASGLVDYIRVHQTVPGESSWAASVATMTGLSLREVQQVDAKDTNSARVYLVYPAFTPSTGSNPILTNVVEGHASPSNVRLMILSTTKSALPLPVSSGKASDTAPNREAFEDIWSWSYNPSTKAPPIGWPAAWTGQGEYLHVERVNLASFFHHVTFSNLQFPTNVPFAKINDLSTHAFDVTNAVDGWYLEGTRIRLFKHDSPYGGPPANPDELDMTHSLASDVNFIYRGAPSGWMVP